MITCNDLLIHCPFCGEKCCRTVKHENERCDWYYVTCYNCHVGLCPRCKGKVIGRWINEHDQDDKDRFCRDARKRGLNIVRLTSDQSSKLYWCDCEGEDE